MRRLASFLVASVLVAVPSCDRTGLHIPASGAGGTMALAGVTAAGGVSAAGGQIGAGGAVSGAGGSGPDTCYSDSDCVRCLWETAPSRGAAPATARPRARVGAVGALVPLLRQ